MQLLFLYICTSLSNTTIIDVTDGGNSAISASVPVIVTHESLCSCMYCTERNELSSVRHCSMLNVDTDDYPTSAESVCSLTFAFVTNLQMLNLRSPSSPVVTVRAKLSGAMYCYRSCLFVFLFVGLFVGLLPR